MNNQAKLRAAIAANAPGNVKDLIDVIGVAKIDDATLEDAIMVVQDGWRNFRVWTFFNAVNEWTYVWCQRMESANV